jgi:hypothetical protein
LLDLGDPRATKPQPQLSAYVVKSDRNGQTYLPEAGDFRHPERVRTTG